MSVHRGDLSVTHTVNNSESYAPAFNISLDVDGNSEQSRRRP